VEKELVEKGERDRRTNYYELTDVGRDSLDARRK
jgi:DNA-binding PadR family transcriptional regulator